MLVSEIQSRVQAVFGDSSGAQLTPEIMLDWINDGQTDICRKAECLEGSYVVNVVSGTDTYDYPDDFIKEQRLVYNGYKLSRNTKQGVDVLYPDRLAVPVVGIPILYFHWNRQFNLYPAPDSSITNGLVVWYIRTATKLVSSTQEPEIPSMFHEILATYCFWRALEMDEQWTAADRKKQEYNDAVMQCIYDSQNLQAESYPAVVCIPGDY